MDEKSDKGPNTNLRCGVCGKLYKSRTGFKYHQQIHAGIRNFHCKVCDSSFLTKGGLVAHLRTHTGEKAYKCSHCPARFRSRYMLAYHTFEHTKQGVQCDYCPKVLPSKPVFNRHLKTAHIKREPFRCHLCVRSFRNNVSLKAHIKKHEDQTCNACGEICKGREALKKHRKTDHRVVKKSAPLICELCGQKYATITSLSIHRAKHKEHQRFKCDQCPKAFFFNGMLEDHKRVETIKIHTCNICGADFTKRHLLQQHADIHGSEYKFKCDMCENQKFKQMAGLRYHWKHFHRKQPAKRKMAKKTIDKPDVTSDNDLITPLYEQVDDHFESEIRSAE